MKKLGTLIQGRLRLTSLGFPWFCAAVFAAIAAFIPLGQILEIGGDEGFELLKAFLCYRGHVLYSEIWNDQPPAYTLLLAGLFKVTGVSLLTARMAALFFGALLIGVLAAWLRRDLGMWSAVFGLTVLLSAPWVLTLGTSVMLEMPAFATGLLAAWLLRQRPNRYELHRLIISAITFAIALQIKLTVGVMVPGILVLLLQQPQDPGGPENGFDPAAPHTTRRVGEKKRILQRLNDLLCKSSRYRSLAVGYWIITLALAYALLCWLLGTGGYDLLWTSHHTPKMYAALAHDSGYAFKISTLADFPEGVAGSVLGAWLAIRERQWRRIAFPTVWLATVLAIHLQHRPWWDYYLLHFVIPMSWLTAQAVHPFLSWQQSAKVPVGLTQQWQSRLIIPIGVLLSALWIVYGSERLFRTITFLGRSRTIQDTPLMGEIQRYAPRVQWMFTYYRPIFAFHARLPVPPPLALLPAKRFWSGRLTEPDLLDALQKWSPELLLLESDKLVESWSTWIHENYQLAARDDNLLLYVHKAIGEERPQSEAAPADQVLKMRVGYGL